MNGADGRWLDRNGTPMSSCSSIARNITSEQEAQPAGLVIAVARRSNLAMIPQAKRTQILKALQSNPNWAAVARQVGGVNRATVGAIARQLGISPSQSGPTKISAEGREKIAEALRINPNASAVAREIGGIDPSTVSAIAKKAGIQLAAVTIGKRKRLSPQTRARIVEALAANPNASRVAREVGDVSARRSVRSPKRRTHGLRRKIRKKEKDFRRTRGRASSRRYAATRTRAWLRGKSATSAPKPSRKSRSKRGSNLPPSTDTGSLPSLKRRRGRHLVPRARSLREPRQDQRAERHRPQVFRNVSG